MKINRRKFVVTTVTLIGGIPFSGITLAKDKFKPVGFGIVTDPHYAERAPDNSLNRYYYETLNKMSECIDLMNEQKVDF